MQVTKQEFEFCGACIHFMAEVSPARAQLFLLESEYMIWPSDGEAVVAFTAAVRRLNKVLNLAIENDRVPVAERGKLLADIDAFNRKVAFWISEAEKKLRYH